jgi:aspartate beta-hydroxylase
MKELEQAQRLLRAGRMQEAERAYEQVLDKAPQNVEALNVVGLAALRQGREQLARELLVRATTAAPDDARSWSHLGRVEDSLDNLEAAVHAYREALRVDPKFFIARLHLASLLERGTASLSAVIQYSRALRDAQDSGRWLNPDTTAPIIRPLVEHAVVMVRGGQQQLFAALLEPLVQRYGKEALSRVQHALRVHLEQESATSPDPRQRPTFFFFPGLPTAAYLERAAFPWIDALEEQTAAIRAELLNLLPSAQGRERVFTSDELANANLRGIDAAPSWDGYYFYRWGVRRDDNCSSCPTTASALDALPLCRIREHGPEVLFSVFTPGTHLLPHRGVTNVRTVAHLPLLVPAECALTVGGETHVWQEGRVVAFDDTYEHEAWNRSKELRVVLIFDLWNPYLSEVERAAVHDLIEGIGDFRKSVADA